MCVNGVCSGAPPSSSGLPHTLHSGRAASRSASVTRKTPVRGNPQPEQPGSGRSARSSNSMRNRRRRPQPGQRSARHSDCCRPSQPASRCTQRSRPGRRRKPRSTAWSSCAPAPSEPREGSIPASLAASADRGLGGDGASTAAAARRLIALRMGSGIWFHAPTTARRPPVPPRVLGASDFAALDVEPAESFENFRGCSRPLWPHEQGCSGLREQAAVIFGPRSSVDGLWAIVGEL